MTWYENRLETRDNRRDVARILMNLTIFDDENLGFQLERNWGNSKANMQVNQMVHNTTRVWVTPVYVLLNSIPSS